MGAVREFLHRLSDSLAGLFHWVEGLADSPSASAALFLIAFAESSFFPIPPDVLLIPLCLGDPDRAFFFAAVCSVGSVLGGLAGYGIGFYGGRPLVRRLFSAERVRAVENLYGRYSAWATGIAGLTPLPYKLFTISGGAFAINLRIFMIASLVSRSLRFFVVAGLIYLFGEPIQAFIDEYFNLLSVAFVVLLVLGFWIVGRGIGKRRTRRKASGREASGAAAEAVDE